MSLSIRQKKLSYAMTESERLDALFEKYQLYEGSSRVSCDPYRQLAESMCLYHVGMVCVLVLSVIFGIGVGYLANASVGRIWGIRFGLLVGFLVICYGLVCRWSYISNYRKYLVDSVELGKPYVFCDGVKQKGKQSYLCYMGKRICEVESTALGYRMDGLKFQVFSVKTLVGYEEYSFWMLSASMVKQQVSASNSSSYRLPQ